MDDFLKTTRQHFASNSKIKEIQGHTLKVHTVAWNYDGKKLASGSYDKTVCIYNLEKDRLLKDFTCRGHSASVDQVSWHPNKSDILASASGDKSVRIWDARSKKSITSISTKGENINLSWSPDGNTIAVGNKDDLVSFIDTKTYKVVNEESFKYEVNEFTWNTEGNLFFITTGQGTINILSYPELERKLVLNAHPAVCICIKFDPTGKYFAVGSADALASLWDAKSLTCLFTFSRLEWPIRTISFSFDGKMLAMASEDLSIDIADTATGEKICEVPCDSPSFAVAWHPSKYLLAFACDDRDSHSKDRDAGTVKLFGQYSS